MEIRSQQEALFIACEMEKSAIQLYTRALMLLERQGRSEDPLAAQIRQTCEDEREHLRQFRSHAQPLNDTLEEQLMLSAAAEGVLFEGGLMDAVRRGLLNDVSSMMNYAMAAEECSARKYREFAAMTQDVGTRAMLETIAGEEDKHLSSLQKQAQSASH